MTVRDSITRTRARTPRVEDDPTSATMRDRALGPTQCGISDVATKCTKGGRKPNICRCMLGAVLSWRCLGRHRLRCQPCSRIGENPPYGMIGGSRKRRHHRSPIRASILPDCGGRAMKCTSYRYRAADVRVSGTNLPIRNVRYMAALGDPD